MKPPRPWTVLPHEEILTLAPNLRAVQGSLARGNIPRRMLIAKRADGRLVFYNAVPLREDAMASLEAWGTPSFLIVPNAFHRLDIHAFKERYPGLQLLCPAAIRAKVETAAGVNGDLSGFPEDAAVSVIAARGTKIGEPILIAKSGGAAALGFGDIMMNFTDVKGFDGFVFKLLGSVGGPRVTRIARLVMVNDRAALRAHLEELAALPGLGWLVPSHGEIVDQDAAGVLRKVAAGLG